MEFSSVRAVVAGGVVSLGAGMMACAAHNPVSPTSIEIPDGDYHSLMTASIGAGVGSIAITPVHNAVTGTLDMIIKVRVQGVKANTSYLVQRAGESGRANSADGVCQRAVGAPPWSPSDPPVNFLFPSFRVPDPSGPEVSFVTRANGNGSLDFEYVHPTFAAGAVFDLMVRLVDDGSAPTSELRSACFTVTSK